MRVLYQFFASGEATVAHRLDYPILFSVATLRARHPEAEVVVLEYPPGRLDWQDFPDRLGFRIVRPRHDPAHHDGVLSVQLARPRDVWEHAAGLTCYCDSDVAWLDRAGGFDPAYVHINRSNAGLFLFDPAAHRAAGFMGLWADACEQALRHQGLRDAVRAAVPEPYLHDESIYRYLRVAYPEWVGRWAWPLAPTDFAHPWDLPLPVARRLHLVRHACGDRRGALFWLLRETRPVLEHYFAAAELRAILGADHERGGAFSLATLGAAIRHVRAGAART